MGADMDWPAEGAADRLDAKRLLPEAGTVMALGCNYDGGRRGSGSPVARYARGRDYHATVNRTGWAFGGLLRARWPELKTYGSVDPGPLMEKVWVARAGRATWPTVASSRYGSWVVLAVLLLAPRQTPTPPGPPRIAVAPVSLRRRLPDGRARRRGAGRRARLPPYLRRLRTRARCPRAPRGHGQHVFGCDVCQDVCPLNPPAAGGRAPLPSASGGRAGRAVLAAITPERYAALVPGTALARAGYDGLRRNAPYALGAARDAHARPVLELARDASELVRGAAQWALDRLPRC